MIEKVLIILLVVTSHTYASKMCEQDTDCADLGDVFCMKSRCEWGLCGCPRGQAMRFLGSEKKFQCVPIRRVGESCSTDGDAGICGAANSECIDGSCQCLKSSNLYSYWGGELCSTQPAAVYGETCSGSLGNCGTCTKGDGWWISGIIDSPLDTLPNTCACGDGSRVALENDFDVHEFTGKTLPMCVRIKHGELCLRDEDCIGMECVDNRCACLIGTDVPNLDGTTCKPPLAKGALCRGTGFTGSSHCDGSKGLVCGDVCKLDTFGSAEPQYCVCDKSRKDTPGCDKRDVGSKCKNDYECKSVSRTGVCVDELCKAGAGTIIGSLFTTLLAVMFTLQQIAWK